LSSVLGFGEPEEAIASRQAHEDEFICAVVRRYFRRREGREPAKGPAGE
jgi:hypothetical protein